MCEPVDDCQEVGVAIRVGKRPYHVQVDGIELGAGGCKGGEWSRGVPVDFAALALDAFLGPASDVTVGVWPHESGSGKSLSGADARV